MSSYKKFGYESVLIDAYVDDLNTIGTLEELLKGNRLLKQSIWNEGPWKRKFCLDLQIKQLADEVQIHQSTYIENVLKRLYMDKIYNWILQ